MPLFEAQRSRRIKSVALEEQPDDAVRAFNMRITSRRWWKANLAGFHPGDLGIAHHAALSSASGWGACCHQASCRSTSRLSRRMADGSAAAHAGFRSLFGAGANAGAPTAPAAPFRPRLARPRRTDRARRSRRRDDGARISRRISTAYLRACKDDEQAFSSLAPGRFLMPGDLDGSPR